MRCLRKAGLGVRWSCLRQMEGEFNKHVCTLCTLTELDLSAVDYAEQRLVSASIYRCHAISALDSEELWDDEDMPQHYTGLARVSWPT